MRLTQQRCRFSDGNLGVDRPALFIAQFAGDEPPYDNLDNICRWAHELGFGGIQLPADRRFISIADAAKSRGWCDDHVLAPMRQNGIAPTHIAAHLIGQLMAVNPAHYGLLDFCGPATLAGRPNMQWRWAQREMMRVVDASANMDLKTVFAFPGNFCFPYVYPWPPRNETMVQAAFRELARRWLPVLRYAEERGIKIAFEVHPQEDVFDGPTWERFLEAVGNNPAAGIAYDPSHFILQGIDPLEFLNTYYSRVFGAHWKDAEMKLHGPRQGVYGGLLPFALRAGRFRSLGDGELDIKSMENMLALHGLSLWRVLEWECVVKDKETGAREGAQIIQAAIDEKPLPKFPVPDVPTTQSFEKFAASGGSRKVFEHCLGIRIPDADAAELGLT
ncbi:MAG: sugar phosphate isomerase/epimerase [Candidatus Peribacteraceae bacterium]|nr:sugar phosphate isomerase/epimerase [Candidatus Peribacteraceae bacterium]